MVENPFSFRGLSAAEVTTARRTHGTNALEAEERSGLGRAILAMVTEPMFLLLAAAATIYFVLGELQEAVFMGGAIVLISAISLFQEQRSRRALDALQRLSHPKARALRDDAVVELPIEELVVGDLAVVAEGELVPADGQVVQANDFSVNESILTGESLSVDKEVSDTASGKVFRGTQAVGGLAVVRISAVGAATELGRIGGAMATISKERSPLERQIDRFVRGMAIVGVVFFLLVWGLNYYASRDLLDSLLRGLTLAMSILPEEIPVAFATFMALGAWRMMRNGVLVKHAKTVETLGAATVICTDKTGTITENRMVLAAVHVAGEAVPRETDRWDEPGAKRLIEVAMWASEPVPFDPMEIALHEAYATTAAEDRRPAFRMVHEYPLGGRPPMMTHIFANDQGERIVAAKGAPEAILACSALDADERQRVAAQVQALAAQGYRVLGVGEAQPHGGQPPAQQQDFAFRYLGVVAFHDPPKANMPEVFRSFDQAGIRTVIITGDNAVTTAAIARSVGFRVQGEPVSGDEVRAMDDAALMQVVHERNLFARMFPEAKLRVVKALKATGEVVAMTGDGVNDGPALKAAHIGVAMGRRGSELAKEAAELVLLDDDLGRMVDAVAQGRRIYTNLKKAIQYIISIHIPIILTVALPLVLGWIHPHIFTPVHVIFLELLMGPTCSIAYESEPLEAGSMRRRPRRMEVTFLSWRELRTSLAQGLVITIGTLGMYQYAVQHGMSEAMTRTLVFTTLVTANIVLTLVNRSFEHSVIATLRYRNPVLRGILLVTIALLLALLYVPVLRDFFQLASPAAGPLAIAVGAGMVCTLWYEGVKGWRRHAGEGPGPVSAQAG